MKATTRQVFREVTLTVFLNDVSGCQFGRSSRGRLLSSLNPYLGTSCVWGGVIMSLLIGSLKCHTRESPRLWFLRARELPKCRLELVGYEPDTAGVV